MKIGLKYIILLVSIILAGTVAYVSVAGLLKLFAGAGTAGLIIFSVMELGKIIMTSALHTYKDVIKWWWKIGLNLMILATMIVTSVGIYGFLSSSYKKSFANLTATHNRGVLIDEKKKLLGDEKSLMIEQIEVKRGRIKDQSSIRGQQETRMDSLYARRWYTAARRVQKSIDEGNTNISKLEADIDVISEEMRIINDSLTSYNLQGIELIQNDDAATELGPLIYLSDVTGMSMDDAMKWFILLIMLIGDPQAVLLVVVFNSIANHKKKNEGISEGISEDINDYGDLQPTPPMTIEPWDVIKDDAVSDVVSDAVSDGVKGFVNHITDTESRAAELKYTIGVDVATEDQEPTIINNETGEIVFPEKKPWSTVTGPSRGVISDEEIEEEVFVDENQLDLFDTQQSESLSESKEGGKIEVVEIEEVIEEKPSESLSESVIEEDVLLEDSTVKYKLGIEDLPEIESDKVNRYSVELPDKEVQIEEVVKPKKSYWVEEMDSEPVPEVKKEFVKGRAVKDADGYKAKIDKPVEEKLSEEEKNKVVQEIIDKKNMVDRGFSKLIPERIIKSDSKNVFIRKRKN